MAATPSQRIISDLRRVNRLLLIVGFVKAACENSNFSRFSHGNCLVDPVKYPRKTELNRLGALCPAGHCNK